MPLLHDPDDPQTPQEGTLPQTKAPKGRAYLKRYIQRNWMMLAIMAGVLGILLIAAIYLAINAAHQPIQPADSTNLPGVTVTPQTGNTGNYAPLANTVPTDANGNPIVQQPAPGATPADWQQYLQWKAACANGQCQQQQQQTPAQQAAEQHRKDLADLEWKARLAKPDEGNHPPKEQGQAQATTPQAPPQQTNAPATPPAEQQPNFELPKGQVNADWDQSSGPTYRLLGGLSVFKARLLTAITGDNKGPVIAETVQPVYSWDNSMLLVPKGSFLTGKYGRVLEQDQERVYLSSDTLVLPNAWRTTFPEADVLDQSGMAGLKDKVNHHYAQLFLTSIAVSAIGASAQFGGGSYTYSPTDALRIGFGAGASQASQQILSRFINRKPTITIRAGQEILIFPPTDVSLPAWKDNHVHQPI